jgi:hypothetical protein
VLEHNDATHSIHLAGFLAALQNSHFLSDPGQTLQTQLGIAECPPPAVESVPLAQEISQQPLFFALVQDLSSAGVRYLDSN